MSEINKARLTNVYGAICINEKGEVLMVRGRRGGKWSFPKGHVDNMNETDLECAKRELFEEAGLHVSDNYVSFHKLHAASYFVFAVEGNPETSIQDTKEIDKVEWVSLMNLPTENCNVDVSIFRTLMKNIRQEQTCMSYVKSDYAHRRITYIRKGIERSKMAAAAS